MIRASLAALVFCSVCTHVLALPDDAEQDLQLEAETLVYDETQGTLTYEGSVFMQQGSMKIEADKVVIYGNMDSAQRLTADGQPARFQQTPTLGTPPVIARADELDYDVQTKSLLLQGNAHLTQEGSSLSGNRIEYDVINSVVKAGSLREGSSDKKRVKMVIPPKVLKTDDSDSGQAATETSDTTSSEPTTTEQQTP
ncbi:lipopolysaccharide transport periplasmic protein LptA [Agaribacterium haliotis]|uniref:lipopolysaccharide transport periplasmic protein LptA n=1 Tax=Agaribacterium haliotis TaxID=2013869 RepID=UPI000BB59FCE|nr:lipopolysaccharide transport periplasmic protein LptA [Agaribacterium haliotis]